MKAKIILIAVVLAAVGFGVFLTQTDKEITSQQEQKTEQTQKTDEPAQQAAYKFAAPKKSAHYESNTPAHAAILAEAPINIVIDFNFDLAVPSAISIMHEGKEYGAGETVIDANKLSMRRNFDLAAPDGPYKVSYTACWPDRSCHDGLFEFAIDRSHKSAYQDLRNKSEITIHMSEILFKPMDVLVSPGTKITWINDDEAPHYINTDSHPGHTYYPAQNSRALQKGENYTVTFDKAGIYPYHCSAHAGSMTGNIIVE
ncbi:MAG: plastocyanin/azurin family copper-binding protein [bacterium]|nr:plastocyanin/azurin family copper-binding protein [bacterium]